MARNSLSLERMPSAIVEYVEDITVRKNKRECFAVIREYLLLTQVERFDTSTGPGGEKWPKLKSGEKRKPLIKTGDLFEAMTSAYSVRVGEDSIEHYLAAHVWYGVFHQFGTVTIPPRRYTGLDDRNIEDITRIVLEYYSR